MGIAGGPGWARRLPRYLQGYWRRGVGKVALQVPRGAEGGQHSGNESQGKDLVDVKGSKDEWSSERQNVSCATVRQALWEAHLQSPMSSFEQSPEKD